MANRKTFFKGGFPAGQSLEAFRAGGAERMAEAKGRSGAGIICAAALALLMGLPSVSQAARQGSLICDEPEEACSKAACLPGFFQDEAAESQAGQPYKRLGKAVETDISSPLRSRRQIDAIRSLILADEGKRKRQGTGFFITPRLLVTAYHLIEGKERSLESGLSDLWILGAKGHFSFKEIIGFSKEYDIALIEAERTDGKDEETNVLKLSLEPPQEEDVVYVYGYGGGRLTAFKSEITLLDKERPASKPFDEFKIVGFESRREISYQKRRTTGGMSGSPVVNERGEVIAVYTASFYSDPEVVGVKIHLRDYAAAVSNLQELWPEGAQFPGEENLLDKLIRFVSF